MDLRTVYAAVTAFLIALASGPVVIAYLRKLKFGQTIRTEGPKEHLKKTGIPTMGGVLIILATTLAALLFRGDSDAVIYALLATVGYGLIGLIDDFIIVVKKRSLGLRARDKLLGQIVLAVLLGLYMLQGSQGTAIYIPFTRSILQPPAWLYLFLVVGVMTGSANAVNLTDGLDGLAAGSTAIAAVAYAIICLALGRWDLAIFAAAIAGACLGFSWYNSHPAQVFMGDTGSLGLGAALGAISILTGTQLFLVIIGGLFVIETLSVMMQVTYFRLTGGRRIFRMSPLHHHFELAGWAEPKVVFRFWMIGFLFAILGLLGLPAILR